VTLLKLQNPNGWTNHLMTRFNYLTVNENSDTLLPDIPMSLNEPIITNCLQAQLGMFIPKVSWW
jgi:hypothetical protein